jgi:pimeloyl-ACP methyl ester carboxylesterase
MLFAARHPGRVSRIALVNPVIAGGATRRGTRLLRAPLLGELAMGLVNRRLLARLLRGACARPEIWTEERVAAVWTQFDQGTQRAILRLYRSIDPNGQAVDALGETTAPVLILWGEQDTWLSATPARELAAALPDANFADDPQAGHWPWLETREAAVRIATFLQGR